MKKLYDKHELLFSLIWIFAYVLGASLADGASGLVGIDKSITLPYLGAMSLFLFLWLKRHGLLKHYGLCAATADPKQYLYYLPLVLAASCNLWLGIRMNRSPLESGFYALSMLLVGFLEELIFRGLLLKAMAKDNLKSAVIVSSLTFGIGHIVNLFNGSGADLLSNFLQILSAVAFGFLFAVVFLRTGSLLPCILTHSVLNALSTIAVEPPTPVIEILISAILTINALAYAVYILKVCPVSGKECPHAD